MENGNTLSLVVMGDNRRSMVKAFRAELGLSAAKFARLLGVGQLRTVQRWEAGENQIPGPVALIIEAARDVPQFRRWLERRGGAA